MKKKVLVIGGYGGVGKFIVEYLISFFDVTVVIAGRNPKKADNYRNLLNQKYPGSDLMSVSFDAGQKEELLPNLKLVDLVIVAATIPDKMNLIAKAALETGSDMIDILFRGDIIDQLEQYRTEIVQRGRIFITQGGFHPGMIAPTIKMARSFFDKYHEARVAMAMEAVFYTSESVHELIYEIIKGVPLILGKGQWKKAGYKNVIRVDFSKHFGNKECYPLFMKEIIGIEEKLGLSNCGAYAAGFSTFIDYVIFPLAMILGKFNIELAQKLCGKLMYKSSKSPMESLPKVELILMASGIKNGKKKQIKMQLESDDGYDLTAKAVIACLNQYFDGSISTPGLYLMGQIVNETRLFEDMNKMGVCLNEIQP